MTDSDASQPSAAALEAAQTHHQVEIGNQYSPPWEQQMVIDLALAIDTLAAARVKEALSLAAEQVRELEKEVLVDFDILELANRIELGPTPQDEAKP